MSRLITLPPVVFLFGIFSLVAQDDKLPNPYEWVIQTYPFPANELARGFATPERGALVAPAIPKADATDQEIQEFIRKSNSVVSHYLESKGLLLPKGGLVVFDPESLTLTARLPRIAQSSIAFTSEDYLGGIEKYIRLERTIIEAPVEMMRSIVERAGQNFDHAPLLAELEKAVREGKATILDSSAVDTRSGNRSKISPAGMVVTPGDFAIDSNDQIQHLAEEVDLGNDFEVDTVLGADGETVDLNVAVNHHYAPGVRKKLEFTQRGKTKISAAVTDTYKAHVASQYTTRNGATKMLAAWKPEGVLREAGKEVMQAAFITNHVVVVLPLINEKLAGYLEKHGEKVVPTPQGKLEFEKVAEEIPEGMIVRRFRVPPSFLSVGAYGGAASADPFAAEPADEPRFMVRATAKDILKSAGIQFPPGSSANYLRASSILVVRNTVEQIQLVEAYMMSIKGGVEKSIAITCHIVQGPGDTIRAAVRKTRAIADHTLVWNDLIKQDKVSILTTNWIEARSGNRAKVEAGLNYHYSVGTGLVKSAKDKKPGGKEESKSEVFGDFDETLIGTSIQVDPVLGADNVTIDLNFQVAHDFAPPTVTNTVEITPESINLDGPTITFHEAEVTTQITMRTGTTRMAGMWSPVGTLEFDNADILQAVFIKAEILQLDKAEDDEWEGL